MGTRYLECTSDVAVGAGWAPGGTGAPATNWEAVDLVTTSLPPTSGSSDDDVAYTVTNNSTSPIHPAAKGRLRMGVVASANPPHKKGGHVIGVIMRKTGTGHFRDAGGGAYDWPSFELWNNGALVAGPFTQTEPSTSFGLFNYALSTVEAAAINWTQSIDLVVNDAWQGSGNCGCRISAFWFEAPEAWSLEASGSSTSISEVELYQINTTASGSSTSEGQAVGQIATFAGVASGSSTSEGQCVALLISGTASGSSSSIGQAVGIPAVNIVASGESTSEAGVDFQLTYPPSGNVFAAAIGGVVAGKGA